MNQDNFKDQEEYKKHSICEYNNRISRLRNMKLEYMKKTEEKECEIKEIQMRKHNFCKSVGGHNFREEIEGGIYGERYKVCATCGLEV